MTENQSIKIPAGINAMIGQVFNRLTVLELSHRTLRKKGYRYFVKCRCNCGTEKIVDAEEIKYNGTKSCGCLDRESLLSRLTKHGQSAGKGTKEYNTWLRMIKRCDPNRETNDADRYVDRGITVCERWLESFDAFFEDMGPAPSQKYSIDRINNDGNYKPDNCRWATAKEQAENRRSNIKVEYRGNIMCLSQLGELTGVSCKRIHQWKTKHGTQEAVRRALASVGLVPGGDTVLSDPLPFE